MALSHKQIHALAMAGLMTALAVVLQQLGAITQAGSYLAALLSGLTLIPVLETGGIRYGWGIFAATLILSSLFVADKEIPVIWFLVCPYPLFLPMIRKHIGNHTLQGLASYLIFLCAVLLTYPIIFRIFMLEDLAAETGLANWLVSIGFFGITSLFFFLYRKLYTLAEKRWRKISRILPKQ